MNIFKKVLQIIAVTLFSIFLFSCSEKDLIENPNDSEQENFIDLSKIEGISSKIILPVSNKDLQAKGIVATTKKVESIDVIPNNTGKASFYIVNYNEGGFIIFSADNRTQPILAFSETGKFVVNENLYPDGLRFWISDAVQQIEDIQNSNIEQSESEKTSWEAEQIQNTLYIVEPGDCPDEIYTVGPLMSTAWDQTGVFNDALPYITCNGSPFQVYAGCVPIAMAQVMRYHQYPANYNWSAMSPNDFTGTTANFINDIHNAIRAVYSGQPTYKCDGTGVGPDKNMGTVLKTQFVYTSADWSNYNYSPVVSNLDQGRPVILSGDNGTKGHMWVCDGYRKSTIYSEDCSTGWGFLHFYMNWGWGGRYNGYYSFNNFNPDNTHYNNNNKMIYNIKP